MAKGLNAAQELVKQNNLLKKENLELRRELDTTKSAKSVKRYRIWNKIGVWFFSIIAAAVLVSGNLVFWAGRSLVDTDRYIAITAPLIEQPAVQQAIAADITNTLFKQVDVEAFTTEVLPSRADFLVPQLTKQLETYTQQSIQKLLASDKFQDIWTETQTTIHNKVINVLKNYEGNGVIDLNDVYQKVTAQLADTKLSFLADKQLPSSVGSITIVNASWLPVAHNLVVNMNLYRTLAILVFVLATLAAVLLSKNRRKQVIILSILYALCALVTLVAIGLTKNMLVSNTSTVYKDAVQEASTVVFSGLIAQTRLLLASSLIVSLLAWISGPFRSAHFFRDRINVLLSGNVHQSLFGAKENRMTTFVGQNQTKLFWGYTGIVGIVLIFTSITSTRLVFFLVSTLLVAMILAVLAAPNKK